MVDTTIFGMPMAILTFSGFDETLTCMTEGYALMGGDNIFGTHSYIEGNYWCVKDFTKPFYIIKLNYDEQKGKAISLTWQEYSSNTEESVEKEITILSSHVVDKTFNFLTLSEFSKFYSTGSVNKEPIPLPEGVSTSIKVSSGDVTLEPLKELYTNDFFRHGEWLCLYPPEIPFVLTNNINTLPTLHLQDTVEVEIEAGELYSLYIYTENADGELERKKDFFPADLSKLSELPQGKWYVMITTRLNTAYVPIDDKYENSTFGHAFILEIDENSFSDNTEN